MARGLILLDRDGVLNRVVVDPEHGTIPPNRWKSCT